jgi:hypothetical protein
MNSSVLLFGEQLYHRLVPELYCICFGCQGFLAICGWYSLPSVYHPDVQQTWPAVGILVACLHRSGNGLDSLQLLCLWHQGQSQAQQELSKNRTYGTPTSGRMEVVELVDS